MSSYAPTYPWQREIVDETSGRSAVKDFATPSRAVAFTVDGDEFATVPALAAERSLRIVEYLSKFDDADAPLAERVDVLRALLETLLTPESAERFTARLDDPARPITVTTVVEVITWLLGHFTASAPGEPAASESEE